MADFERVAKASDVAPGEVKGFKVNGEDVAIANVDGRYFAFGDSCPHQGAQLSSGLGAVYGEEVVCMLHDSAFSLISGQVTDGPSYDPLPIYAVRVEGDDLLVGKE